MKTKLFPLLLATLLFNWNSPLTAQSVDHWETIVYANDNWRFFIGSSEPSASWNQPTFSDVSWPQGQGGIGYGDNDDGTVITTSTLSLYMRLNFNLIDPDKIARAFLYADYDDAFVAYLNGVEIARANIGTAGDRPRYNQPAAGGHEAQLYSGGVPEAFVLTPDQLRALLRRGSNTLAVQVHNQDITSSDLSSNFFLIAGIADNSRNYRPVPPWFSTGFDSSNLPLIVINTRGQAILDDPRITADMNIIDNGPGQANRLTDIPNGYQGQIGIEVRGASSQGFPKKNYSFETRTTSGGNRNVSLLGMPAENDWVLHGPYSDKSLMRNVLTYHLGRLTGQYASRTRFCELFINDQYQGLYVLLERIKRDNDRVDIANLQPQDISGDELTGGYIFQIDRDRPNVDDGWYSPFSPTMFYAYADPGDDELVPQQKAYIQNYIQRFERDMMHPNFVVYYEQYVDLPSFVDYLLVTEITKHIDAFRLSFYMYKEKDSDGGKLHFGPLWDYDLSYGNWDYGCSNQPDGWAYNYYAQCAAQPFWLIRLMNIPEVRNQVNCRWRELRNTVFRTDRLTGYIDSTANAITDASARNFARWNILGQYVWPNSFIGKTHQEEVDFLKNWLTRRLAWMDANILGSCTITSRDELAGYGGFTVWPNPFSDQLQLEWNQSLPEGSVFVLTDALGRPLVRQVVGGQAGQLGLRMPRLPAGMYFYQVYVDGRGVSGGKVVSGE